MAGAIELTSKGKVVQKVAPSTIVSLTRPLFQISIDLVEGMIEAGCWNKG